MLSSYHPIDIEKTSLDEDEDFSTRRPETRSIWHSYRSAAIVHVALICLYTLVATFVLSRSQATRRSDPVHTPAKEGISYQVNSVNVDNNPWHGVYTGDPGPEVDENWRKLLRATNIRVSEGDLQAINRTSIPLNDDSGDYWASLNVHHHLHCLEMMRHYIAIDFYPHDTEIRKFQKTEGRVYPHHIEHCIEGLRLWLICQPDTHLLTYEWPKEEVTVPDKNHAVTHQCVDWSRLEQWAFDRSFDLDDGLIEYPDGRIFPPVHHS